MEAKVNNKYENGYGIDIFIDHEDIKTLIVGLKESKPELFDELCEFIKELETKE